MARRSEEFIRIVWGHGAIRTRMVRVGHEVRSFTVQFEVWTGADWRPAVRYDSAHGHAHRDTLDWDGRVVDKLWLEPTLPLNEAMVLGEQDLIGNAAAYLEAFIRRKP